MINNKQMEKAAEYFSNKYKFDFKAQPFHKGISDGLEGKDVQKLNDKNYLKGWYEARGVRDGYEGKVTVCFEPIIDIELFDIYFESFVSSQYDKNLQ